MARITHFLSLMLATTSCAIERDTGPTDWANHFPVSGNPGLACHGSVYAYGPPSGILYFDMDLATQQVELVGAWAIPAQFLWHNYAQRWLDNVVSGHDPGFPYWFTRQCRYTLSGDTPPYPCVPR